MAAVEEDEGSGWLVGKREAGWGLVRRLEKLIEIEGGRYPCDIERIGSLSSALHDAYAAVGVHPAGYDRERSSG